jgi:hypothetical protein
LQTGKICLTYDENSWLKKYPAIKFGGSASDAQMERIFVFLKRDHFYFNDYQL